MLTIQQAYNFFFSIFNWFLFEKISEDAEKSMWLKTLDMQRGSELESLTTIEENMRLAEHAC